MKIENILQDAVKTFSEKRKQYGSTDQLASAMLKLAYPDGISPEKYNDALVFIKITEKLIRISSSDIKKESKSDAYGDIVGYGLLGLYKDGGAEKVENAESVQETTTPDSPTQKTEQTFEEKKAEEQGYYNLNTLMADRAKAEHEELQKEKMRKLIEEGRQAAQQKLEAAVQETVAQTEEPVKKKDEVVQEDKMINVNCRLCGFQIEQKVSEAEVKAGKVVVHNDCYTKWQREQKALNANKQ